MHKRFGWTATVVGIMLAQTVLGQIDPEKRQLVQLGYNQPLEGHGPVAGYAYYYRNDPGFLRTNITLRLALAPVYMDSELGFRDALGEGTDLGLGAAGGGFANSYSEIRNGHFFKEESFTGHGAEVSASAYHLFDPRRHVPLTGILRLSPTYALYERDDKTLPSFQLPEDHASLNLRAGLRLGGREPVITPEVAMELSIWYEGQLRDGGGTYGFNGDRSLETLSHLFWARGLFIYTLPQCKHNISVSLTTGTTIRADRFSAYRLGGDLPLSSEFPLILPGYYYQELSARDFTCFTMQYSLPLDAAERWSLTGIGTLATVDYLRGWDQKEKFNSGAGIGIGYRSPSGIWRILGSYGYGFQAIRSSGEGAQSVGILCQIDLERHQKNGPLLDNNNAPQRSRGLLEFFRGL